MNIRAYVWPSPGRSTHARIVDTWRWRITRLFVYPALAGIAVIAYLGFTAPDTLHGTTVADSRLAVQTVKDSTGACNWDDEVNRTITELGADPANWHVGSGGSMSGKAGVAHLDSRTVTINPIQPCEHVADTVRHEWMHLQQGLRYGGWDETMTAMGSRERAELAADCGAMLLGADYLPYLDGEPCTPDLLAEARRLIDGAR